MEVHRSQNRQRMQNDGDDMLVVGDAQARGAVASDLARLAGQHAPRIDGGGGSREASVGNATGAR